MQAIINIVSFIKFHLLWCMYVCNHIYQTNFKTFYDLFDIFLNTFRLYGRFISSCMQINLNCDETNHSSSLDSIYLNRLGNEKQYYQVLEPVKIVFL